MAGVGVMEGLAGGNSRPNSPSRFREGSLKSNYILDSLVPEIGAGKEKGVSKREKLKDRRVHSLGP